MSEIRWIERIVALSTAIAALGAAGSAFYTARQASISSETMYRQLRPYVTASVEKAYVEQKKFHMIFKVTNHGQTPAMRTSLVYVDYREDRLPTSNDISRAHYSSYYSATTVDNGGSFSEDAFTSTQPYDDMMAGKKPAYYVVVVTYDDVFAESHTAAFCFQVFKPGPDGKIGHTECPVLGWETDITAPIEPDKISQ